MSSGPASAERLVRDAVAEHAAVLAGSATALTETAVRTATEMLRVIDDGGTIFAAGNGGSAADAQHFVTELVGRYHSDRAAVSAIALGSGAAELTAIANDTGFGQVFARPLVALASAGDMFVAISTSGASPNVVAAAEAARQVGCLVVTLTGADGGALAELGDISLRVPSNSTARVQEMHGLFLHAVAEAVEAGLLS